MDPKILEQFNKITGLNVANKTPGVTQTTSRANEILGIATAAKTAKQLAEKGQVDNKSIAEGGTSLFNQEKGKGGTAGKVLNAATHSEQEFGKDIGQVAAAPSVQKSLANDQETINKTGQRIIESIHKARAEGRDTTRLRKALNDLLKGDMTTANEILPVMDKTNKQIIGDAAGTALDIATAGSYGKSAEGAKSFQLLSKTPTAAATQVVKTPLKETLKTIGKETAQQAGKGAATGYAYDVTGNLQNGKEGGDIFKPGVGAAVGGSLPLVIGGVRAGVAITKEAAPKFINSLIKPKQADFSYGKDPGSTVS